ncbi:MAG: U32 family peptidase [Desulfobacterales bacterium]|nr:U32 family peptidase [Desulfobacterales bacterium]
MIEQTTNAHPSILAPAGDGASFLAAIAAGADAVYCGLKSLSARMEARNFTIEELIPLTRVAHDKGVKVYVALNSLIKPDELDRAGWLLEQLSRLVKPDGIIIQDLALVQLARQTGFSGELHLSTLANVSFLRALELVRQDLGVDRVVVPRELSIDEIKALAQACPQGLSLAVFVHGALCYGVSGRCYWSSYLGGKSGLRGRCVQPCRRLYTQDNQTRRFFSCQDLSLDVLAKVLLSVPEVKAWKIEGRKKSPHYVFHTVKAYRILRDLGRDPQMKKKALALLAQALGRTATHYNFLSQRPQKPVNSSVQTGSGLLLGRIKGTKQRPYLSPREEILPGDLLRVGYEDEPWHSTHKIRKYIPKRGRFDLKPPPARTLRKGTPVFLIDRREQELEKLLSELQSDLSKKPKAQISRSTFNAKVPNRPRKREKPLELHVYRSLGRKTLQGPTGLWLSKKAQTQVPKGLGGRLWWWLPPVIWPDDEKELKRLVNLALEKGGRNFVLNAPWQAAFFGRPRALNLWAGPFCNLANSLAISTMASLGFAGAIVSPELGRNDYLSLPQHSPLPLGVVISGNWPLSVSRTLSEDFKTDTLFASRRGEQALVRKHGPDFWVYPNWALDIRAKKDELQRAGYSLFVHLIEPLPGHVKLKKRPGLWNWDLNLL